MINEYPKYKMKPTGDPLALRFSPQILKVCFCFMPGVGRRLRGVKAGSLLTVGRTVATFTLFVPSGSL